MAVLAQLSGFCVLLKSSMRVLSSLVGILFLFALSSSALYEENAGVVDWYRANIGEVTHTAWHPAGKKIAFVATASGVVAALRESTGEPVWRQVLPQSETIVDLLSSSASSSSSSSASLVSLSSNGVVRCWQANDGNLLWETSLSSSSSSSASSSSASSASSSSIVLLSDLNNDHKREVAVVVGGVVTVLSGKDGAVFSQKNVSSLKVGRAIRVVAVEAYVVVISVKDSSLLLTRLDASNALSASSSSSSASFPISSSSFSPSSLIVTSDKFLVLGGNQVVDLKQTKLTAQSIETVSKSTAFEIEALSAQASIAIDSSSSSSSSVVSASFSTSHDQNQLAIKLASSSSAFTSTSSSASSASAVDVSVKFQGRGGVKKAFIAIPTKKSSSSSASLSVKMLVVGQDQSLSFITVQDQTAALKWTREEALASITQAVVMDLPVHIRLHELDQGYPSFISRLLPQLQDALSSLSSVVSLPVSLLSSLSVNKERVKPSELVQDHFGFRKLILTATASGKIYALDSFDGVPVWSKFMAAEGERLDSLYVIHHGQNPRAVAVISSSSSSSSSSASASSSSSSSSSASSSSSSSSSASASGSSASASVSATSSVSASFSRVVVFEPLTGEVIKTDEFSQQLLHVSMLPLQDASRTSVLMMVDKALKVQVYPSTPETQELLAQFYNQIFFRIVEEKNGTVTGYALHKQNEGYEAVVNWQIAFEASEKIAAVSSIPVDHAVHSPVRSGKQTLFKYLNPNLLALATTSDVASGLVLPGVKKQTDSPLSVTIYLIDAVTGNVVNRVVHKAAKGPVSIVQSENVVVYSYLDCQTYEQHVSVVELYEDRSTELNHDYSAPFSSLSSPPPTILQQTYTFRTGIKTLGVSKTSKGITSKDFIVGTIGDQLLLLPKALLDPRRYLSEADKEEGLAPYARDLPFEPLHVISYNRTIANLRDIQTADTLLESTSVVLSYGMDVFCTRVTPSQTFDQLSEEFSFAFLIMTVCAVAAGIVFTSPLARKKKLDKEWK